MLTTSNFTEDSEYLPSAVSQMVLSISTISFFIISWFALNILPNKNHAIHLCSEIYVTYNKKIREKSPNTKTKYELIEVEDHSLSSLLSLLLKRFQNQELLIIYGDTLISYPKNLHLIKSTVFVTEDINIYYPNWFEITKGRYFCGSIYIDKKTSNNLSEYNFKNTKNLLNTIKDFQSYLLKPGEWYDFGHFHTYFNSRKKFLETRIFNNINIASNGFLKKSSSDTSKMICEFNWFKEAENLFPEYIPKTRNLNYVSVCSYEIEYFNFPVLSDVFVFGNIGQKAEQEIIKVLVKTIKDLQKIKVTKGKKSLNFISTKLKERKEQILETCFEKEINLPNLEKLIDYNIEYFQEKDFENVFMHGDFCFSNILYNRRTKQVKLIDPRGYTDKTIGYDSSGPFVYDFFKLAHSFIGGYDQIIAGINPGKFELEKTRQDLIFFSSLTDLSEELIINGVINLFLSMIPLHHDNNDRQNSFAQVALSLNNLL